MWHKAEWMGRPMRLELTRVGLLVKLANRYTTKRLILKRIINVGHVHFKPFTCVQTNEVQLSLK